MVTHLLRLRLLVLKNSLLRSTWQLVAVISAGRVLASGTVDEVRDGSTLEDRFVALVGGRHHAEGPEWLRIS